ncbi:MAG: hypothetical protein NTV07_02665 [Candidatus Omnitrophica bacterium]|nr:hypothetical protein [Candidatus Omnitrophota bacterium]
MKIISILLVIAFLGQQVAWACPDGSDVLRALALGERVPNHYSLFGRTMKSVSDFFERRGLLMVGTTAMMNAAGLVLMNLISKRTHPMQVTSWIFFMDLIWAGAIIQGVGSYKTESGRPGLGVYKEIFGEWQKLKARHKLYIAAYTLLTLTGSCLIYFALPHVGAAIMLALHQLNLIPNAFLSYRYLGETKGWKRKLLGMTGIISSNLFMVFAELRANPAFKVNLGWVAIGVGVGFSFGTAIFLLRKLAREIETDHDYAAKKEKIFSFLPLITLAFNYITATPILFAVTALMGIPLLTFMGVSIFTGPVIAVVIFATFFFVMARLFQFKLSRKTDYDWSNIIPGLSSTSMIAAMINQTLHSVLGIGSAPFNSIWSWFAPAGVIAGAAVASPPSSSNNNDLPTQPEKLSTASRLFSALNRSIKPVPELPLTQI